MIPGRFKASHYPGASRLSRAGARGDRSWLGGAFAGAKSVGVGQDVLGPLRQRADVDQGGRDAAADRPDQGRHELLAAARWGGGRRRSCAGRCPGGLRPGRGPNPEVRGDELALAPAGVQGVVGEADDVRASITATASGRFSVVAVLRPVQPTSAMTCTQRGAVRGSRLPTASIARR